MRLVKYFVHEHHLSPPQVFTDLRAFPAAPPATEELVSPLAPAGAARPRGRDAGKDHPSAAPQRRKQNPARRSTGQAAERQRAVMRKATRGWEWGAGGKRELSSPGGACNLHPPYLAGL